MTCTRPIVRYFGGKWKLAPWIAGNLPAHRVYVEPFGGGGSVLLRKPRSYAEVYNDIDGEIVNLFRVARDHGGELRRLLELTPFSRDEFNGSYEAADDPIEQARKTIARCFMGFGANAHAQRTGFRSCSNRSGTTPAHDWRNYPKTFGAIIERLRGVVIENRDAIECMVQHDSHETLFYVDPPYVHSTRSKARRDAYRFEMSDDDHHKLATYLHSVHGTVVLSGYDSDLYQDLYRDWTKITKDSFTDGAKARTEVLWISRQPRQGALI